MAVIHILGVSYATGRGVAKDEVEAVKMYAKLPIRDMRKQRCGWASWRLRAGPRRGEG